MVAETSATVLVLPKTVFLTLLSEQKQLAKSVDNLVKQRTAADTTGDAPSTETSAHTDEEPEEEIPVMPPEEIEFFNLKHRLGRFPAVRQQSVMDCGAACLATVCRYYGKYVSLKHAGIGEGWPSGGINAQPAESRRDPRL